MTGVKNSIQCFKSRLDHYEERIYNPEDRTFEITQNKKKQEWKRIKKAYVPGASMGIPTHDKVMRDSPDGQGESGLKGPPLDLPERLPQNQNLSVLLFYDFYQLLWH